MTQHGSRPQGIQQLLFNNISFFLQLIGMVLQCCHFFIVFPHHLDELICEERLDHLLRVLTEEAVSGRYDDHGELFDCLFEVELVLFLELEVPLGSVYVLVDGLFELLHCQVTDLFGELSL